MLRVRNAPEDVTLDDLLETVPSVARLHPEVALALHDRAVGEGRLADAEKILRGFLGAEHEWAPPTLALGITILQQETSALRITLDGPVVSDTARLSEAADLFTKAMGQIPEGDPEGLGFSAHLNRGTARRLLREFGSAHEDFRKAYELKDSDAAAVIHFAQSTLTHRTDPDEAITLLLGYLEQHVSLEVELLLSECLWRREGEGDFEKAEETLVGILPRLMDLAQADQRAEVVAILVDLYIQSNRGEDAVAIFEGLPEGALEVPMRAAIRGEVFRKLGRTDEALAEALAAAQALDDSTDWNVVRHVAFLLERLDRYGEAFELWRKVAQPEFVSTETMHLLISARKAGDDRFVIEFCRQLRDGGHYDHRALSHEVEVLTSYSEFTAAREAYLDYLKAKPDDKIVRLNLTILALQLGWDDLVEGDPSCLPRLEELDSPGVGAIVADVLRAGPHPVQAVNYAYDVYQRFPDESSAHKALIVSVLAPGPGGLQIQKPTHVAPGTAVCYCEVGSEERRWLVVEDSENPSLTRDEYPVSHSLVNAMLGKSVGEEFPLSVGAIRDPTGKILELLDKRVYRANELLTGWKERFPDEPSFEAVPVRVSDSPTPDDFGEMLAIMKRLSESRERVEKAYADGRIPIATMAKFRRKTVFETVTYLAASLELPVRASRGTTQDRTEAIDALENAEVVVLGPSTIATLALIEEVELLGLLPLRYLVTEGTIRELRSLTREDIPKASGYMGYKDGRLWLEVVDDEREAQRLERLRTITSSLEQTCQIIGGGDLADVDASVRKQLSDCVTPGAAESVAAASRRGAVLWTDDHLLHELVKGDLPSPRVWTDVVFHWALDRGTIKREHRSRVVARLLRHGYFFTGSSSPIVIDTCEVALWRPEDPDLAAVLADFGRFSLEF